MKPIELHYDFKLISKDNEKIFNRQGRPFLSSKYKKFDELVRFTTISQYNRQGNVILENNLSVTITANFKNKVHCDIGNLPKGILDSLQGIIYKNDNQIKELKINVLENGIDYFSIYIKEMEYKIL